MTSKKKLEAVIDSLTESLEIVSHNPVETEYVLSLRTKYEEHYKLITGRYYRYKDISDVYPTEEWKRVMDSRFNDL